MIQCQKSRKARGSKINGKAFVANRLGNIFVNMQKLSQIKGLCELGNFPSNKMLFRTKCGMLVFFIFYKQNVT